MIKIYGTKTSPFVRKVRIVAIEKKLDWQFECFEANQTEKYSLNGKNPLGKIPVLLQNDNIVVFDSPVIAEYLDNLAPYKKLFPEESSREKMMVRRWEALADGINDIAVNSVVYERLRPADKQMQSLIDIATNEINASLDFASSELADKEFCIDQHLSIGDIALLCALDFLKLRVPEINWQEKHANLASHHERMYKLSSVIETSPF